MEETPYPKNMKNLGKKNFLLLFRSAINAGGETVAHKKSPPPGSNARPQGTQAGVVPDCVIAYLP